MILRAPWLIGFVVGIVSVAALKNPKRGLAFADGKNPVDIAEANQASSVLSWQYDWGTSPPSYLASSGIPYVPMQWGAGGASNFSNAVHSQGVKVALTFNEPDLGSQSNLTPQAAVDLWKQYVQPLKSSGVRLGAPAVTNGPSGRPWLSEFLSYCTQCNIDFIPFHWYGDGLGGFYDYVWQMHGQFPNYPLWITEFASTSSDDEVVLDFLNQSIHYLDTLDFVERYAWFGYFRKESNSHYNLLDISGELSDLGRTYVLG
ncbi:glycoside hydrolase [Marasmius fiardii PR-910]|nr:glycoside hydrolase [Marasmius fiardii PR-910]